MNNKITFPELVRLVAEATSTTQRMSELFLKELFATISQALIQGQNVTIKNLGTFEFVQVQARQVVNVHDGEPIEVPGHKRLVFTPDRSLAETINLPFSAFEPIVLSDDMTDEMLQEIDQASATADETADVGVADDVQPLPDAAEPSQHEATGTSQLMPPPFRAMQASAEPSEEHAAESNSVPIAEPIAAPIAEPVIQSGEEPALETEVQPASQPDKPMRPVMAASTSTNVREDGEATVQHYMREEFEQSKRQIAHRAFIKGLVTGILATLALIAIIWAAWNSGRNSVLGRTVEQADTISDETHVVTTQSTQQVVAHDDVVTDTCTTTLYLTKMSVKHYGKPDFWVYIYEENLDKISDPNNVTPGTVVVIPPASKYGIDPDDKASIDHARRHAYDLLRGK